MKKINLLIILIGLLGFFVSCSTPAIDSKVTPEERKKNFAILKTQLAIEFINIKDYRSAVNAINEAVNADPYYAYAWMVKGIVHQYIKDYSVAINAYLKALSIDSKSAEINNNYGWFICNDLKEPHRSLAYFDKALIDLTYPTPELAYMNKGICLGKIGQYSEAELYLNKSIMSNPNFPYSVLELSRLKYNQGKYMQAKQYFDNYQNAIIDLRPQDLELGYYIASHLGNTQDQHKYIRELHTKYPYSAETLRLSH